MTSTRVRVATAVAAGLSAAIALTACGSPDDGNKGNTTDAGAGGPIAVDAKDDACSVTKTSAEAGVLTFDVTNNGSRVTEFYLYAEGDRIMGEVENIGPGLKRTLRVEVPRRASTRPRASPA